MSRALLAFNPEAHGSDGDTLLFGVTVPAPARRHGVSELEELDSASRFLEAPSGTTMARLLAHIMHRASARDGRAVDPDVARPLLHRLARAAATVRAALRPGGAAAGSAISPETLFGTELEGLSPEDREFETARRFVRFASEASRIAARAAQGAAPQVVASHAERLAAHRLAPGLPGAVGAAFPDFHARHRARLGQ